MPDAPRWCFGQEQGRHDPRGAGIGEDGALELQHLFNLFLPEVSILCQCPINRNPSLPGSRRPSLFLESASDADSQDDVEASGSVSTVIHRCQGGFVKGFVLDCRLCRLLGEVCVC